MRRNIFFLIIFLNINYRLLLSIPDLDHKNLCKSIDDKNYNISLDMLKNITDDELFNAECLKGEKSILDIIIENDDYNLLKHLINSFNVNNKIRGDNTILMEAINKGKHNIIKFLLNNLNNLKLNINAKNKNGDTVLKLAIENGDSNLVNTILSKNPKLGDYNKSGDTELTLALNNIKDSNIIKKIVDKMPILVNKENLVTGEYPLKIAIKNNNLEAVKILIENQADINKISLTESYDAIEFAKDRDSDIYNYLTSIYNHGNKSPKSQNSKLGKSDINYNGFLTKIKKKLSFTR